MQRKPLAYVNNRCHNMTAFFIENLAKPSSVEKLNYLWRINTEFHRIIIINQLNVVDTFCKQKRARAALKYNFY